MEKITKDVNTYNFNELEEQAKEKAITSYIDFMVCMPIDKRSNLYKAIKKAEDMNTPWFTYNYIYEYCEKAIIKELKKHKYFKDGDLYE